MRFCWEVDVTRRSKIAVSAFYVKDKTDYGTFKITKLKYHKRHGWQEDGAVSVSPFTLARMGEFVSIIASLDLGEAKKTRLALENLHIEYLPYESGRRAYGRNMPSYFRLLRHCIRLSDQSPL